MLIHVLTTVDDLAVFNYPLLYNSDLLAKQGLSFRWCFRLTSGLSQADAIFINSKFFRSWFNDKRDRLFQTLESLRRAENKIFWYDTTDGTGSTQFEVLPYVDRYFKNQLFRDLSLYEKPFYGGRIYTDFYHNEARVVDESPYTPTPLDLKYKNKIALAWNSALGAGWAEAYFQEGPYSRIYHLAYKHCPSLLSYLPTPLQRGPVVFKDPFQKRSLDVSCRVHTGYSRATVRYQREQVLKRLSTRGAPSERLGKEAYQAELANTKVAVSPFGWGEICWRDWDILQSGSLLMKPDVSHLSTWPDLFEARETYLPFRWDFQDFESQINDALSHEEERMAIATRAQNRYHQVLGSQGQEEFCRRIVGNLEKKGSTLCSI